MIEYFSFNKKLNFVHCLRLEIWNKIYIVRSFSETTKADYKNRKLVAYHCQTNLAT